MDLIEFMDRVKFIPNCFNLNIVFLQRNKLRTTLEKMDDSDTSIENTMFDMMHHNLASFIYLMLSEFSQSETAVQWVLKRHPRNIQANTTKSVLCFNKGHFTEAEELIENLHRLSEDEYLMAEAEAEMAHAYSRLGPRYYSSAITIFDKVTTSHPQVYEWKYRLALTIRRCQQPEVRSYMPLHDVNAGFAKCKQLFEDVIEHCNDNNLKSLAYVEMAALFIFPYSKGVDFRRQGIHQDIGKLSISYLDKAMKLDEENAKVLTEAGRILRSLKQFSAAKDILEHAVQLKPGTKNCHHLALALQKLAGSSPDLVIAYLEQSVEFSKDLNLPAIICLAKAYLEQSPPDVTGALKCCKTVINTKNTHWVIQGSEQAFRCCTMMASQIGISSNEKTGWKEEAYIFHKIHIISRCLVFLKTPGLEKINSRELFAENLGRKKPYYDFNSPKDQIKRAMHLHKGSTELFINFQKASSSIDITRDLVQQYFQRTQYHDCLDLVTMLLITDLPGIKRLAIDTMMQVVPLAVQKNDLLLAEACFKRPLEIYYDVDEVVTHIRIISNINTSGEEVNLIKNWLEEIGLKVTHNDEDIMPYMNQRDALISAMSSNTLVICIFKDNKCHILDGYPIQMLQADKPVILPMLVNGSQVSPIVENYNSMPFPSLNADANERGQWLKALGDILFENI